MWGRVMSEFSVEQQSALDVVLSILSSPAYQEQHKAAIRPRPAPPATNSEKPSQKPIQLAEASGPAKLVRISRRTDIPLSEKHVLVMWGLSTYQNAHPLGTTFVVNNSVRNALRESEYKSAVDAATKLAEQHGLDRVYLLDD